LSIIVENDAGSMAGEYGSVIFIGAVLGGAPDALGLGAGAGLPPQAAASTTTNHPALITDTRAALFMHAIFDRYT
jgi:hypothetical protein